VHHAKCTPVVNVQDNKVTFAMKAGKNISMDQSGSITELLELPGSITDPSDPSGSSNSKVSCEAELPLSGSLDQVHHAKCTPVVDMQDNKATGAVKAGKKSSMDHSGSITEPLELPGSITDPSDPSRSINDRVICAAKLPLSGSLDHVHHAKFTPVVDVQDNKATVAVKAHKKNSTDPLGSITDPSDPSGSIKNWVSCAAELPMTGSLDQVHHAEFTQVVDVQDNTVTVALRRAHKKNFTARLQNYMA
jgi:hypothetical protein